MQTLVELLGLDFYPDPLSRCSPRPVVHRRDVVGGVLSRCLPRPVVHGRDMVGGGGGCEGEGGCGGESNARRVSRGCTRGIHGCPEGCTRGIDGIWTSNSHLSVSDRCEIKSRFENLAENTTPSPDRGGFCFWSVRRGGHLGHAAPGEAEEYAFVWSTKLP